MKLIEITGKLKTKFNPSQIMNSLERAADFYDESDNDSEGDDSAEDLKDNPYGDSINDNDSVRNSKAIGIFQKGEIPLIKLTNVWKIYQMGEVEFAAFKGINLEIYEGEFLVVLGPSGSGKAH